MSLVDTSPEFREKLRQEMDLLLAFFLQHNKESYPSKDFPNVMILFGKIKELKDD